jgi:ubiquinone/menaquinone biosynthesis C-methylase UbiE
MTTARYDGQTEWYESITSAEMFASARDFVVRLLGKGPGRCLDLGCGTGRAIPALSRAGWSVVGTDISIDQLEAARAYAGDSVRLVRGDAHALPFGDGEFDAVVSVLTHTDFDDVVGAFGEASRVLREGGAFVYLGVHPCFASPFVKRGEGAAPVLQPGYRRAGWHVLPADLSSAKIRARVGINHLPLAGLLNAITRSGLTISQVEEPGDADPPFFLAVKATKR